MKQNNNFSVLPWYTDIREQNHRRSYAYGSVYPLYTMVNTLLPFQIIRPKRNNAISAVKLYTVDGLFVADITETMKETGLQIVSFESYDVIVYTGLLPMATNIGQGQYYVTLTDGVDTWFSEVFAYVNDLSGYLKIEWHDKENLYFDSGMIVYQSPAFKNRLYFATELGKPDYTFEEEGETRDGYFFPEKQLSEKTYKCTILAPEYLCDVMRFIRMADYVTVTDKYGRKYDCDTFLITPKWQTQGDLASVEIEFETDTVAKKIGRGYYLEDKGDFNEDYKNDYLINAAPVKDKNVVLELTTKKLQDRTEVTVAYVSGELKENIVIEVVAEANGQTATNYVALKPTVKTVSYYIDSTDTVKIVSARAISAPTTNVTINIKAEGDKYVEFSVAAKYTETTSVFTVNHVTGIFNEDITVTLGFDDGTMEDVTIKANADSATLTLSKIVLCDYLYIADKHGADIYIYLENKPYSITAKPVMTIPKSDDSTILSVELQGEQHEDITIRDTYQLENIMTKDFVFKMEDPEKTKTFTIMDNAVIWKSAEVIRPTVTNVNVLKIEINDLREQ